MNCLELRQRLLSNPNDATEDIQQHCDSCDKCRDFSNNLLKQSGQLQLAMQVPVPPRLAERVLLSTSLRKTYKAPYAIAAAVFLAITITGATLWRSGPQSNAAWSEIVLAHVLNERDTLEREARISSGEFGKALSQFGLSATVNLGEIRYLEKCDMPGGKGLHVVIHSAAAGLVTLIIPPKGTPAERGSSQRDGFVSAVTRIGGIAVGIVTDRPQQLGPLQQWIESGFQAT